MSSLPAEPGVRPLSKRRTIIKWTLTLLVLGGMCVWAYFKWDELSTKLQAQWDEAHLSFADFGYGFFITGLVIYFVSVVSTFFRWWILVHALKIPFSIYDSIRLGFVGYVSSQLAPGSITGDVIKVGFVWREQPNLKLQTFSTIMVDRFIGLYSLFLLASVVALFNINQIWQSDPNQSGAAQLRVALLTIWGIAGGGLIVLAFFLLVPIQGTGIKAKLEKIKFVGGFLARALSAFGQYRHHRVALSAAILVGMLGHIGFVLSYYFASRSLPGPGETPSWLVHFLIIPFFMVFQALPISFGGNLGIGDALLGKLYEMIGGLLLRGILASLLQRVIGWIVALLGLIWYVPLHRQMKAGKKGNR
jgi:hypothetical protein